MRTSTKNRKDEQEMINAVKQHYNNIFVQKQSSQSVSGRTKYCDITLKYNGVYYHLEAKHNNDYDNSNYCKQMLAECLYNRNKHKDSIKSSKHQFGILLDCSKDKKSKLLQCVKSNYFSDDWKLFGRCFKCTAIFLYDMAKQQLYYMKWDDVYENNEPISIYNSDQ